MQATHMIHPIIDEAGATVGEASGSRTEVIETILDVCHKALGTSGWRLSLQCSYDDANGKTDTRRDEQRTAWILAYRAVGSRAVFVGGGFG
jgi:hypothetical protein